MKRVYSIGLTALAGLVLVSLAPQGALAQDRELAAGHDQYSPTPIVMEPDRAGFYTVATERLNEDVMSEAISDFEHHIGWPETGRPSPAVLGALREYNVQSGVGSTQF